MKEILRLATVLLVCSQSRAADPLRFAPSSSSTYTNVTLQIAGPTNLVIQVERLNRTNDVWEYQGLLNLGASGSGTFTSPLIENAYGFYRAKATNNSVFSTNGFGAVVASVAQGYTLVGNVFGTLNITNVIRNPVDGTAVYRWYNGSNSFNIITYDSLNPGWAPGTENIDTAESVFVYNPGTTPLKCLLSGLLATNTVTKPIPSGWSLLSSPGYHVFSGTSWQVDLIDTNRLGGFFNIPVQTTGFNPQATIATQLSTAPSYKTNSLTSGNVWTSGGTNSTIPLNIVQGFWLNKPTNATWQFNRTLW